MARAEGLDSVVSRIDDLGGRLATAKNLSDVQEAIGRCATAKQVIEIQETQTKLAADVKGVRTEMADLRDFFEKAMRKLRDEIKEAIESVEPGDGDDGETLEFLKEQIGEFKGMAKAILGDDATIEVIRKKVRGWVGGKDAKKLPSGDDTE